MTIPEQDGRPVWEPMARAALELGVAAMMVWGLLTSLYRAVRWTPGRD